MINIGIISIKPIININGYSTLFPILINLNLIKFKNRYINNPITSPIICGEVYISEYPLNKNIDNSANK